MIQIEISQFEQVLPFVSASSEDVFQKIEPSFDSHYYDLVATYVGAEAEKAVCTEGSPLYNYASEYIILATFLDRLRSQDVIMTDNGFGVVSNDNIAPASQTRVDALERELTYRRDTVLHNVINRLRQVEGWADSLQAHNTIRSFVWSPYILGKYCGLPGKLTFDDLAAHRSEIAAAESFLRQQFGDAQIDQLLEEERTAQFATSHRTAIQRILDFIGSNITQNGEPIDARIRPRLFESLLRYVEEHLDDFAKYRESSAYTANHMQAYENKTDDTTFFFAG